MFFDSIATHGDSKQTASTPPAPDLHPAAGYDHSFVKTRGGEEGGKEQYRSEQTGGGFCDLGEEICRPGCIMGIELKGGPWNCW